jgi:CHAD domain-containing protein
VVQKRDPVPPFSIGQLKRQLLKVAGDAQLRNARTAILDALGSQVRSWFQRNGEGLVRQATGTTAEIQMAAPSVPANQAVAAHLATLVQKRLTRLTQSRDFDAADDPADAIHDLRVASRRLRAFVEVFSPLLDSEVTNHARSSLKAITRAARAARDLDVQLGQLLEYYARTTADIERAALEELIARTQVQKKEEVRRLRKRLKRLDWNDIRTSLSAVLGTTVTHLPSSEHAVSNLTWQLLEPWGRLSHVPGASGEQPAELHEFRIRLKKLRYALELFEPVMGSTFDAFYAPVESLQELLGYHHDLFVLEGFVERQRRELELAHRTTLARAMLAFEARLKEQRRAIFEDCRSHAFDIASWQQALKTQLVARFR